MFSHKNAEENLSLFMLFKMCPSDRRVGSWFENAPPECCLEL
jgi:hypothetical protein